jgi:hypothetical protein
VSTVHSSTSSFERAVPPGRWGATWLVVAAAVLVVVVGFELFLRGRGYQPSIKDDEYTWAWQRARVADDSSRTVALLGSSRIMLAFSGEAFTQALPGYRFAQLGINGTTPIGALWDLARDEHFRGVAIVDISEGGMYETSWIAQDKQIAAYHHRHRAVGAMAESWLAVRVQSRLALLATRGLSTWGKWLRNGSWPRPPYVVMHPDRTRFADFSLADLERERRVRIAQMESWDVRQGDGDAWLAQALEIEPAIAQIEARGGKVVYVRMPTCDQRWANEEQMYPKAVFWDRLAAKTHAVTVHFKDFPELSRFECPDTSHIAGSDGPAFTRALLDILRARGVFAR